MRSFALAFCLLTAATAQADDLALGHARMAIYRTVLETQVAYLQRTAPAEAFGPEVQLCLARAQLLLGRSDDARKTLARRRVAARADAKAWTRRCTLWRLAADGEPTDDAAGADAVERAFLLAVIDDETAAALALLGDAKDARAACVLLRAGKLEEGAAIVARLRTDEAPLSLELDLGEEDEDEDPDAPLLTEIVCWSPEVWLARALLPLARAARSTDPVVAFRARAAMGEPLATIDVDAPEPWRQTSRIAKLALSIERTLIAPLGDDPAPARLRDAASCAMLLGRPKLALALRQRALDRLRRRGGLDAADKLVDEGGARPLRPLELVRFAMVCGADVDRLGAAYLACARAARHQRLRRWYGRRAFDVLDERFARARRGNLWEFDLGFLAELGRVYLHAGRYDQLVGYLYRRRTVPELGAAAQAVRSMARELQAFQAFDRQRKVEQRTDDGPPPRLEQLLFGADDPTPAIDVVRTTTDAGGSDVATSVRTPVVPGFDVGRLLLWLLPLLGVYAVVWWRRWRLLRKVDF